ncbi:MAG: cytochrome C oxidase subunit IV family protein [Bryobacteraceae bacterium]
MAAEAETNGAPRTYAKVLVALLALTVITVAAAGVHFGSGFINVVIALAIASVKASLVALYFMHLRHDPPFNAVIFVVGLALLAIFLMFCFLDTLSREPVAPTVTFQQWERAPSISPRIFRAS